MGLSTLEAGCQHKCDDDDESTCHVKANECTKFHNTDDIYFLLRHITEYRQRPCWLVRDPRVADPTVITADNRSCLSVGWKERHRGPVRPAARYRSCTTIILSLSLSRF